MAQQVPYWRLPGQARRAEEDAQAAGILIERPGRPSLCSLLTPLRLERNARRAPGPHLADGSRHEGVTPCALSDCGAEEGLSLVGSDGHELLWIAAAQCLANRGAPVDRARAGGARVHPVIEHIESVTSFSTPCTWIAAHRPRPGTQLQLKGEEDIRRLAGRTICSSPVPKGCNTASRQRCAGQAFAPLAGTLSVSVAAVFLIGKPLVLGLIASKGQIPPFFLPKWGTRAVWTCPVFHPNQGPLPCKSHLLTARRFGVLRPPTCIPLALRALRPCALFNAVNPAESMDRLGEGAVVRSPDKAFRYRQRQPRLDVAARKSKTEAKTEEEQPPKSRCTNS